MMEKIRVVVDSSFDSARIQDKIHTLSHLEIHTLLLRQVTN